MESVTSLNGQWTGKLVYGKKYKQYAGKELLFDFDLSHNGIVVEGTAMDTSGDGMSPDKATISGQFIGDRVDFIKQYPTLHYSENEQIRVDKSRTGYPIYYSGFYDLDKQKFSGHWEYRIKYKFLGIFPATYRCGGSWTMHRK